MPQAEHDIKKYNGGRRMVTALGVRPKNWLAKTVYRILADKGYVWTGLQWRPPGNPWPSPPLDEEHIYQPGE